MATRKGAWRSVVRWGLWGAFTLTVIVWIGSGWFWASWGGDETYLTVENGRAGFRYEPSSEFRNEVRFGRIWREFSLDLDWRNVGTLRIARIPLWYPALALGLFAGECELRRRERWRAASLCTCGYPIAGLSRCPECGAVVA